MAKTCWAGFWCAVLLLVTAGCSGGPSDALLVADARNRLGADQRIHAGQLQVSASHGVLTLTGTVSSEDERFAAAEDASRADGLKVLVNNVRVVAAALEKPTPALAASSVHRQDPLAKPTPVVAVVRPDPAHALVPEPLPIVTDPPAAPPTHPIGVPATPVTTASSTPVAAVSATVPPAPEKIAIPYGTALSVRLLDTVSSDLNDVGDKFTASLASPVMLNDKVVIPAEASIRGRIVEVQSSGRFSGKPSLALELSEIAYNGKSYSLRTSQFSKEGKSRTTRTAETVGGGAGVGAILGAIVGGGRGAAIGAAIGAAVGTGVQAKSRGEEVALPAETILSFRLKSPLEVEPSSMLQIAPNAGPGSSADPYPGDRPVLKRRPGSGAADPVPDTTPTDNTASDSDAPPVLKRRPN
jgi:hypothetical protein